MNPQQALADVDRRLHILRNGSVKPAFEQARDDVYGSIGENFDNRSAPDGGAWQQKKIDDGYEILEVTGFLRAAATGQGPGAFNDVNGRDMTIGIDTTINEGGIIAADIHDRGLGNMPERHFYAATEQTLDGIGERIGDAMHERLLAGGGE